MFWECDVYRLIKVIGRQLSVSFWRELFVAYLPADRFIHAQRAAQAAQAAAAQGQFCRCMTFCSPINKSWETAILWSMQII